MGFFNVIANCDFVKRNLFSSKEVVFVNFDCLKRENVLSLLNSDRGCTYHLNFFCLNLVVLI